MVSFNNKGGRPRIAVRIVETNEVFESIRSCARYIQGDPKTISAILHGQRSIKTHHGYHFEIVIGGGLITDKEIQA